MPLPDKENQSKKKVYVDAIQQQAKETVVRPPNCPGTHKSPNKKQLGCWVADGYRLTAELFPAVLQHLRSMSHCYFCGKPRSECRPGLTCMNCYNGICTINYKGRFIKAPDKRPAKRHPDSILPQYRQSGDRKARVRSASVNDDNGKANDRTESLTTIDEENSSSDDENPLGSLRPPFTHEARPCRHHHGSPDDGIDGRRNRHWRTFTPRSPYLMRTDSAQYDPGAQVNLISKKYLRHCRAGLGVRKQLKRPKSLGMANCDSDLHHEVCDKVLITINGVSLAGRDFFEYEQLGSDVDMLLGSGFGRQYDVHHNGGQGFAVGRNRNEFFYFRTQSYNRRGLKAALSARKHDYLHSDEYHRAVDEAKLEESRRKQATKSARRVQMQVFPDAHSAAHAARNGQTLKAARIKIDQHFDETVQIDNDSCEEGGVTQGVKARSTHGSTPPERWPAFTAGAKIQPNCHV